MRSQNHKTQTKTLAFPLQNNLWLLKTTKFKEVQKLTLVTFNNNFLISTQTNTYMFGFKEITPNNQEDRKALP